MVKRASSKKPFSGYSLEAAKLFGLQIKNARISKRISATELAERAGISRNLVNRVEEGDLGCSIGAYFEIASILAIPLFHSENLPELSIKANRERAIQTLLPHSARQLNTELNDDF